MAHETSLGEHFIERKTARISMTLVGEVSGLPIPGAALTTLTVTLFDKASGTFLPVTPPTGTRNKQDILGTNGGAVDSAGKLTLDLTEDDMQKYDPTLSREVHGALFEWTYLALTVPKSGGHTVWFSVYDVEHV